MTVFCVEIVSGTTLQRRNTEVSPPCFLKEYGNFDYVGSIANFAQKIAVQMKDFKIYSEALKESMKQYCAKLPDSAAFMNLSSLIAAADEPKFKQDYCKDTKSFLKTMRSHYDMLNNLAYYFEKLHLTAKDVTSRDLLELNQDRIYDCMCCLKMALHSQNQNPVSIVPSGDLSDVFKYYHEGKLTTCQQQKLEYTIVFDSLQIADYLESMYNSLTCA